MPTITVTTRNSTEHGVEATVGASVMEAICDASFDELLAICGGRCSCATCHVYVEEGGDALPSMSADEDDLLDSSDHRTVRWRLSCQLPMATVDGGLRVRIAAEDCR